MVLIKTEFIRFCKSCDDLFKTNHRYATVCLPCQIKDIRKNRYRYKISVYINKAIARSTFRPMKSIKLPGRKGY